ncbi:MAG: NADH-quinone oxidoreductase subunit M, partial [Gammaproteobacteria bacterium]|nr:NADH-quinone oxidoreductase subunit M [Gammaproteobacteria bacterium]
MLRILLFLPLLGSAVILFLPRRALAGIRAAAILAAAATLVFAVFLLMQFDTLQTGPQYFETHTWNPRLGTSFSLGLDGLSASMVLLATLLCLVAVLTSGVIRERVKGYYLLLLLLESALIGVFTARDWSLFYVFWELTLIPLFFLIDRWGGEQRHRAALNFVLYTMGGSVFMLMALLAVYDMTNAYSFDMSALQQTARSLPVAIQTLLFVGLFIGFGVKMPIVPLHGWLPLAHVEAPGPVSILLSGILLKMGSYGLLRAAELLPQAMVAASSWLAVVGIVSILYGAVLAWRQRDLKAMIAYSSISHMGIVLFALATLTPAGLTGAMMQMIAHGFTAGILFLVAGLIYERTRTRDLGAVSNLR